MTQSTCDPGVVGAIAMLQSVFAAMPMPEGVASLIEAGLVRVPGVSRARLKLVAEPIDTCAEPAAHGERIWIDTVNGRFGWLDLVVEGAAAFAPYAPYVWNLANAIALHAETVYQRNRLERTLAERERAEEALREADRRKTEFLAMLSHELRNPLAPIRNSLYILARAAPGGEQARRALAVIEHQVQHTTRLVDDLLDVTRITRGKVRLQRERVDLNALAHRAVEDHRELFAKSGIHLDFVGADKPVIVNADATRIAQVIGNLLQNALKFTLRGGQASVSVERDDGCAVITVRDTGAGIAPENAARMFEPFVQADSTLERSAGGLGLGLALVKGLIDLHGGNVRVESGGLGKGSTFVARLPLETHSAPVLTLVPTHPRRDLTRRVLLVEDDIDSAETLKEALQLNGHAVEIALTGIDGLEKARFLKPDVIVCDIGLPGRDGFQVARAVRADPDLRRVPLIALSGYAQPEDLEKARQAGFDVHLAKPPDLETLMRTVAQLGSLPAAEPTEVGEPVGPGSSSRP